MAILVPLSLAVWCYVLKWVQQGLYVSERFSNYVVQTRLVVVICKLAVDTSSEQRWEVSRLWCLLGWSFWLSFDNVGVANHHLGCLFVFCHPLFPFVYFS